MNIAQWFKGLIPGGEDCVPLESAGTIEGIPVYWPQEGAPTDKVLLVRWQDMEDMWRLWDKTHDRQEAARWMIPTGENAKVLLVQIQTVLGWWAARLTVKVLERDAT